MNHMKKLTALLLAATMTLPSLGLTAVAADPNYKVGEIGDRAYLMHEDGYIDMSSPSDQVSYGKTFYYPLINSTYTGTTGNDTLVRAAKAAYDAAKTAMDTALADLAKVKLELDALQKTETRLASDIKTLTSEIQNKQKAIAGLEASSSSSTTGPQLADKKAELVKKEAELTAKQKELSDKKAELDKLQAASGSASADLKAKQDALTAKQGELDTKKAALTALLAPLERAIKDAEAARAGVSSTDTSALESAATAAQTALNAAKADRDAAQAALNAAKAAAPAPAPDSSAVQAAQSALADAESVLSTAKAAQTQAQKALDAANQKQTDVAAYAAFDLGGYNAAKAAYDALVLATPAAADVLALYGQPGYDAKLAEIFPDEPARAAAKTAIDAWGAKKALTPPVNPNLTADDAQAAVTAANSALTEAQNKVSAAQGKVDTAKDDLSKAKAAAPAAAPADTSALEAKLNAANTAVSSAQRAYDDAKNALEAAKSGNDTTALDKAVTDAKKALEDKKVSPEYKTAQSAVSLLDTDIASLKGDIANLQSSAGTSSSEAVTKLQEQIKALEETVKSLSAAIDTLKSQIKALESGSGIAPRSATMPDLESLKKELATLEQKQKQAETELAKAKADAIAAGKDVSKVEAIIATAQNTFDKAKIAYDEAQKQATNLDTAYPYVYENDATRSIRLRTRWEQGGSLVKNVEVVKKRIDYSTKRPAWMSNVSQKYAYFLAINLKPSTTTRSSDLYGSITLNKSGTYGFDEIYLDVYASVTYPETENSGYLPKTPALFTRDNGIDQVEDQEFRFAADDDSYFTVNTVNQDKILLGLNCDYDPDIANKFPNANLDFFNGNGATFNRIGVMSLYADEKAYIYEVKSDGSLTKVNSSYDRSEEVHTFKTRTLGRYIVSDRKLDLTVIPGVDNGSSSGWSSSGSSSSSSGSGSTNGNITVVPGVGVTPPSNNPATGASF